MKTARVISMAYSITKRPLKLYCEGVYMGRNEKPVDWDQVEKMMMAECKGTEIAAWFNMHPDTFYRKVNEKFNMGFTEFWSEKVQRGNVPIKLTQYNKAVKGDNTQLIWLGKNRLGQRDSPENREIPLEKNLDFGKLYIESEYKRMEMEKKLKELEERLNASEPKTDPSLPRIDSEI